MNYITIRNKHFINNGVADSIFYTMRNIKQNARMDKKTCILFFFDYTRYMHR